MFGQKWNNHIRNSFHTVKSHLGNAYTNTRQFLGHVDNGVRFAKKAFAVVAPLIDKHLGGHVNKKIMDGLSGYDAIKHRVVSGHDEVMHHAHKLKKLV